MGRFTDAEIAYLQSQRLGRLATVDTRGNPHVVPVSFRYNAQEETIDIGGHNLVSTKKYRDALSHGRVAFVVDDVQPPWQLRMIEVRGNAQGLSEGGRDITAKFPPQILRIIPTRIISFGLNGGVVRPEEGRVDYSSRNIE
jgi:pyridoxamine 5'-phosphate oxidase family protein